METKRQWTKIEANQTPAWNGKDEDGNFLLQEGSELEGQFVEVKSNLGPNHANLYFFKQENGEEISVWGSTILDARFKNLVAGEMVKIVYLGEVPNKVKGRAAYRNYEVYHAAEAAEGIPVINEEGEEETNDGVHPPF